MKRYQKIFKEESVLEKFKNYETNIDEDELSIELLKYFKFKPDRIHETVGDFVVRFGKKGKENAVCILGGLNIKILHKLMKRW